MSRFWDIFNALIYLNLAIGVVNAMGVFSANYAVPQARVDYNISDMYESANTTGGSAMDQVSLLTMFFAGLGFIKDFAVNSVWIFNTLSGALGVPPVIAGALSTIVALSWFAFFIQLLLKWSFRGTE